MSSLKKQYEAVQKRAFLKWSNIQLRRAGMKIDDLDTGFKDGVALCTLCEVISGEKVGKRGWSKKPKNNIQMLENLSTALKFLNSKVKLVGIGNRSIFEGNITLILGLLWTIILRFQVQEIEIAGVSGKKGLIMWAKKNTKHRNPEVNIKNLHSSWKDGLGFCALIEKFRPDLMDYDSLDKSNAKENLQKAFDVAEKELGIPALLDPEDFMVPRPDEKTVTLYVAELFKYFSQFAKMDAMVNGVKEAIAVTMRHDEKIAEYNSVAKALADWIEATGKKFDAKQTGTHLEDISKLLDAFSKYQSEEKPRAQAQLFSLEGLLGSIRNSQRHNKRPAFEPSDELSVATLEKAFEGLVDKEAGYEQELRNLYTQFRKYTFLLLTFKAKREQVSTWIEEKAGGVEDLQETIKAAKTIPLAVEANQSMIAFLDDAAFEQKRFAPLLEELANLASQIKEPFHAAKVVSNEVEEIKSSCDDVMKSLAEQREASEAQLKSLQDLQGLQASLRKESALLNFNVNSATEKLKEPVVEESIKAVSDHLEKVKAMVDESKPQFATLLKKVQDDMNTLQESGLDFSTTVSVDDLAEHVQGFSDKADQRLAELEKQLQLEKDRDATREEFAKAANALKAKLDGFSNDLLKLGESSPEDGLKGLESVNEDIASAKDDVAALKEIDAKQKELDVVVNDLTKESVGSLEAKHGELEKISEKMANDFNAAMNAGANKLTPKQVKELKKIFDEFAKGGDLKTAGFHTACTGMGIVLTDEEAEDMFNRADADNNGSIDFSEFLALMEEQLLTSSSKEDVLSSFKTMAGGKGSISAGTLKQHFGNFEGVFGYIESNMSDEGDYKAFTEELFSR